MSLERICAGSLEQGNGGVDRNRIGFNLTYPGTPFMVAKREYAAGVTSNVTYETPLRLSGEKTCLVPCVRQAVENLTSSFFVSWSSAGPVVRSRLAGCSVRLVTYVASASSWAGNKGSSSLDSRNRALVSTV